MASTGVYYLDLPLNFQLAKVSGFYLSRFRLATIATRGSLRGNYSPRQCYHQISHPNNDNDNIMEDILALGLDRGLNFSRVRQGYEPPSSVTTPHIFDSPQTPPIAPNPPQPSQNIQINRFLSSGT